MSSYPNTKDSAGRPGAGIKPGSLCLVVNLPPEATNHTVVTKGVIVTAVRYVGTDTSWRGITYHNLWVITNSAIADYCASNHVSYCALPAYCLKPINDPGLDTQLLMDQLEEQVQTVIGLSTMSEILTKRVMRKFNPI